MLLHWIVAAWLFWLSVFFSSAHILHRFPEPWIVSEAFLQSEPWTPDMGDPCFYTTCNCWWCLRGVPCPGKHNPLLYSRCTLQDATLKKVSFLTRQKLLFCGGSRPVLHFQSVSFWQVENENPKNQRFLQIAPFKAAPVLFSSTLTMDEMTMCNVKEVKDEHHRELSLDSAVPLRLYGVFRSLSAHSIRCSSIIFCSSTLFTATAGSFYLSSAKWHRQTMLLVYIIERLVPNILGVRRPKQSYIQTGGLDTRLQNEC